MADTFVRFFRLSIRPGMDELTCLLRDAGIGAVSGASLPRGMRGFHSGGTRGMHDIQYDEEQWEGAQEHTVLHETYEIILDALISLRGIPASPRRSVCREADRFAAAVLMQPEPFAAYAVATGFDVVPLQRRYRRSYASVTLRLAEVMRRQPLFAVLYEAPRSAQAQSPAALRATVVARTPGFGYRRSPLLTGQQGSLPWRGAPPPAGSAAEQAARTGTPIYAESTGAQGIALAVRPVRWGGQVAKIAVAAVPYRDRSALLPQIAQGGFTRLGG